MSFIILKLNEISYSKNGIAKHFKDSLDGLMDYRFSKSSAMCQEGTVRSQDSYMRVENLDFHGMLQLLLKLEWKNFINWMLSCWQEREVQYLRSGLKLLTSSGCYEVIHSFAMLEQCFTTSPFV